jgi:putative transposase
MTREVDSSLSPDLVELIIEQGLEGLQELIRIVVNAAMQAERQRYLGAGPYERTPERRGQANGFKPKQVTTRLGPISFAVPQVRDSSFYPQALEKGLRSERALTLALAEMYVQGVSTRKVAAITEQLCGVELTSSQVSRASAELDEVLERWRNRPLGVTPYLFLDARYEKVRYEGQVRDAAVLIASGVMDTGKRTILGVSVSLSEHEAHWRQFLQSLVARGMIGVQLVTSDGHEGLKAARKAVLGAAPWQRCQFHLQQNASAYVPRQEMKAEVAADLRAIFTASNRTEADALLGRTVAKYVQTAPKLADWMENNVPEGLTVLAFPTEHRQRLRTVNALERLNQEIRRRTRVVRIFPNEAACLRLVSALAMETSDDWETGKVYLTLSG